MKYEGLVFILFLVGALLIFSTVDNITGKAVSLYSSISSGACSCTNIPVCTKTGGVTNLCLNIQTVSSQAQSKALSIETTKPSAIQTSTPKVYASEIKCIDMDFVEFGTYKTDFYKKAETKTEEIDYENSKEIRRKTLETKTDRCASSSDVIDFYCEKGRIAESRIKCPSGVCTDGACTIKIEETAEAKRTETSCIDKSGTYNDKCYLPSSGSIRVIKYYPQNGKCNLISPIGELCPIKYRCVDGKCIHDLQAETLWTWIILYGEEYQKGASSSVGSIR